MSLICSKGTEYKLTFSNPLITPATFSIIIDNGSLDKIKVHNEPSISFNDVKNAFSIKNISYLNNNPSGTYIGGTLTNFTIFLPEKESSKLKQSNTGVILASYTGNFKSNGGVAGTRGSPAPTTDVQFAAGFTGKWEIIDPNQTKLRVSK